MRIRPIITFSGMIAVICAGMMVVTTSALLMLESRQSTQARELDEVVRQMSAMRSLQPDLSGPLNPRAIQQWRIVYGMLTPMLAMVPASDEQSRTIKARIRQEHATLGSLFSHLVSADQGSAGSDIRALIWGELSVRTAAMISEILNIRNLEDARGTIESSWLTAGAGGSVAALIGVILVLMQLLHRRIVTPLARLERATANLSAGNLDQPVVVLGNDEVSALAASFDGMRTTLRDRLRDLGETSTRLADANAHLEQRVQERTGQLEAAFAQIQALDEVKSQFFANVSHELRTPLALILGPVDELLAGSGLPPASRHELGVVRRNAQTLLTYVNDLLDLSRLDAGQMQLDYCEADLVDMAHFVADHFSSRSAQRGIDLSFTAPSRLGAQIDHGKIIRVLFNLLSNAFKYVPATGGRIGLILRREGERAIVEVADNGPGVRGEMRERIFQRFVQGDSPQAAGGSGLGLAIAREFVVRHGGSIEVENGPGCSGSLFRVVLPLAAPAGTAVAREARDGYGLLPALDHPTDVIQGSSITSASPEALPLVLVVEDNLDLRTFIARALAPVARVAVAGDGKEGLLAAEKLQPDLILTDIMMPRMSGDQMLAELRAHGSLANVPVIVLSARADDPLRIRLLRGQAQDYLVKPFATDELRARVANLLQIKRARDLLRAEVESQQGDLETLAHEVAGLTRRLRTAADEMRVARDKAEQASRAKSAFLNMVSHELRTPLTQLELQLELYRKLFQTSFNDRQKTVLTGVAAAMHRLSRLVSSVLEYSRIEGGRLSVKPTRFDLAQLVAEACADVAPEAKQRGLAIICGTADTIPPIVSDPALIGVIVHNLLDNAIKFTRQGTVSVRVASTSAFMAIEVADTGPGIPTEFRDRMYEPFEQLEDIDQKHLPGVGLGLALVREIAEVLGGRVSLTSASGQGCVFVVELPIMEWDTDGARNDR